MRVLALLLLFAPLPVLAANPALDKVNPAFQDFLAKQPSAQPSPKTIQLPNGQSMEAFGKTQAWCRDYPTIAAPIVEGVPVWFVESHRVPIVALRVQFRHAGFAHVAADKQGLAHLAANLLLEGAGEKDAAAFHAALESHAIQLSANVDEDMLDLELVTLREHAPLAFTLLTEALTKPRFDAEAIARLRLKTLSDLKRLEEDPGYLASRRWRELVYPNHAYRFLKRGTEASVAALTREDFLAFTQTHLTRTELVLSASGDASVEDLRQWLAPLVAHLPTGHLNADIPPAPVVAAGAPVTITLPVPQTEVMFSLPGLPRKDPDYFGLLLLNQVLGGGTLTSRLSDSIRDKGGLAYSVGTSLDNNAASNFLIGSFGTRGPKAAQALQLLREELEKLGRKGITETELKDAKDYTIGSLPVQLDGTPAMANFLASLQRFGFGRDYFCTRNQTIGEMPLARVNALAKRLFSHAAPTIVAVGQPNPPLTGAK